ncbi:hypothetical protein [Litorimonas sp.]|uniref:hypothetical protein n=1 Tax=Litorimonas sp. TaxID=1892381 RepID=UPI003A8700D9
MRRDNPQSTRSIKEHFQLPPTITQQLKMQLANTDDREPIIEKGVNTAVTEFRKIHPRPVSKSEIKEAKNLAKLQRKRLNELIEKRSRTHDYIRIYQTAPFKSRSPFERFMGSVSLITLTGAMLTIPTVAAVTISETDKFAFIRDFPALAFMFGLAPFAGVLSAVSIRDTFSSDGARNAFDRLLLLATIFSLFVWAILAALMAYPIGGEFSLTDGFDAETTSGGFSFGVSPAILLIWTVVLDICAAPSLHTIAEKKLFPKRYVGTEPNPEAAYLDKVVIPKARKDLDAAEEKLTALRNARRSHKYAEQAAIQRVLTELETVPADIRFAKSRAVASLFDAPDFPSTSETGD